MSCQELRKPVRVALIGLSASAVTSWASSAHLPYLLSDAGRQKYIITALCNSSVTAAENAIQEYKLEPSVKPYGNPEDLARDDNVDLIVCNTRVDKHYETVLPSIKAGKAAYIEWPVASSMAQTDELVQIAKKTGAATLVGLQGRWAAPVAKVRELIQSARLGKVLSSDLRAFEAAIGRGAVPSGLKYFADRQVGGNSITIVFSHVIDWIQYSIGELNPETLQARMQLQRPDVKVFDPASNETVETVRSNVPDLLTLHGELPQSANVVQGATFSAYFRGSPAYQNEPALTWSVVCEKGEIRLVSPLGAHLQAYACDPSVKIHIDSYEDGAVQEVEWKWSEAQEALPLNSRSVREVYEAFAAGDRSGWVSLEEAALRARQIDGILSKYPQ